METCRMNNGCVEHVELDNGDVEMSCMVGVEIEEFQSLRQMVPQNVSVLGEAYPGDGASPLDLISNQK
jgi:hypothetical protein